jgi:hypothetical protein
MIVRIMGEGQFRVSEQALDHLNELDSALEAAVTAKDQDAFSRTLADLLGQVRTAGEAVPDDELAPSELILPSSNATLAEVAEMLTDEGLIPG